LPAVTTAVLIDGFSQPGFAGTPLIELNGSQAGPSDGFTITASDVTVRGLEIVDFPFGAGISLSGTQATGDTIEANEIGTDSTGAVALPNEFGVQISGGANDNLVGGATAAAGNVIAFNTGPGVVVVGNGTVGNQITANQIYSNETTNTLQFDGSTDVSLPNDLVDGSAQEQTIEARFETTSGGVIFGYQTGTAGSDLYGSALSMLYVGTDGRLYGGSYSSSSDSAEQVVSSSAVNDGLWHSVALVIDGASGTMTLYLDGQLVGSVNGSPPILQPSEDQIGTGYTGIDYFYLNDSAPATPGGWYGFVGQIADVRIWNVALTAGQVEQNITSAPVGTEPGLEADYPLDEGQGQTAYDLTSNQNDGVLSGSNGDLPTWVAAAGEAIDLGDDGITYNGAAPRQGPNNLQNYPIITATADGGLKGWLGGSTPDTTFLVDLFASAAYSPAGGGEAQDYLGSLNVTTDSQGQAIFNVPFTPPPWPANRHRHRHRPPGKYLRSLAITQVRPGPTDGAVPTRCSRSTADLLGRGQ
jgi:Concanavalin A-like lectin/glucanases superfamily